MKRPLNPTIEQDINFLNSFSCDIIASLSIAPEYDLKELARAIERLFGQHGDLEYSLIPRTHPEPVDEPMPSFYQEIVVDEEARARALEQTMPPYPVAEEGSTGLSDDLKEFVTAPPPPGGKAAITEDWGVPLDVCREIPLLPFAPVAPLPPPYPVAEKPKPPMLISHVLPSRENAAEGMISWLAYTPERGYTKVALLWYEDPPPPAATHWRSPTPEDWDKAPAKLISARCRRIFRERFPLKKGPTAHD
jgi:hypothetical protein